MNVPVYAITKPDLEDDSGITYYFCYLELQEADSARDLMIQSGIFDFIPKIEKLFTLSPYFGNPYFLVCHKPGDPRHHAIIDAFPTSEDLINHQFAAVATGVSCHGVAFA